MTLRQRFNCKVARTPTCWWWHGAKNSQGYGKLRAGNKWWTAHRISYLLHKGKIPPDLWVLHRCDNPSCVNPDHLFLGTRQDNIEDARQKGRLANKNPRIKAHFCPCDTRNFLCELPKNLA